MSRALVTGGSGFIGSHLVDRLVAEGHEVTVIDDFKTGSMAHLEGVKSQITIIKADLLEKEALAKAVAGQDYVFHLAALASVNISIENPLISCRQNVLATVGLLKAAADAGVKRLIFSSSASVYGFAEELPVKETHPLLPASPYAQDKVNCENYCRLWSRLYGVDTAMLRYFNVYGPRQNPVGVHPGGVTIVINQIRESGKSQVLGDGRQTRDMIYVGDVVKANMCAIRSTEMLNGAAYNICTGSSIVVAEMHETISELMGMESERESIPMPEGNVIDSMGDATLAKAGLGFEAQVTLEEGLKKTIEWSTEHA